MKSPRNRKNLLIEFLITTLFTLVVAYTALATMAFFFSDGIIFPRIPASYSKSDLVIQIPLDNGKVISCIFLPNNRARYTILYSHGNAEDLGRVLARLKVMHDQGYSVFCYDYPGYGTSEGRATEKSAYASIKSSFEFLTEDLGIRPQNIIVHGKSVGGGPATDLASHYDVGGLVLESTFLSAFRVFCRYPLLPWDKFNNKKKIGNVDCPTLVIHGTEDEVIPYWHGKELYDLGNDPKMFFWVSEAGHNNLLITLEMLIGKRSSNLWNSSTTIGKIQFQTIISNFSTSPSLAMKKRILVLLMNGVEEMEAVTPIDLLRRAGASVITASVEDMPTVTGRNGISVKADCHFLSIKNDSFDLIIVPGGPGFNTLLKNKSVLDTLKRQNGKNGMIGAICAAPAILQEAGLLDYKNYTAHFTMNNLLPMIDLSKKVVVDSNIITSQGAGTAIEFSLTLIEKLFGSEKRTEISKSICFS